MPKGALEIGREERIFSIEADSSVQINLYYDRVPRASLCL